MKYTKVLANAPLNLSQLLQLESVVKNNMLGMHSVTESEGEQGSKE